MEIISHTLAHREFAAISSDAASTAFTFLLVRAVLMGDELENEKASTGRHHSQPQRHQAHDS